MTMTITAVEVGFTENRTNVTEGLRRDICVEILNLNSEDIDPTKLLLLELSISPNTDKGTKINEFHRAKN